LKILQLNYNQIENSSITLELNLKFYIMCIYFTFSACPGEFSCGHFCIDMDKVCDRVGDCDDHSDEANCGKVLLPVI
jgi:hypothetical protein